MTKKEKNKKSFLKELTSTPRGKGVVFFGAYLLFFIVIAIIARTGGSGELSNNKSYETGSPLQFSLANIQNSNYQFTYEFIIDNTTYLYQGTKTIDKELFNFNNTTQYYANKNVYFMNNSGVWINTQNPYILKEFVDIKTISSLIEASTYVSKTEYDSGKNVYSFSLSSASISKLLNNTDLDIEEIPNELIVGTDNDNYVNSLKFNLDSYCKVKQLCTNSMKINLSYELFGEVDEIISPLEGE